MVRAAIVGLTLVVTMVGVVAGLATPHGLPRCPKPNPDTNQCPSPDDTVVDGVGCTSNDGDVCRCNDPAPPCWVPGVRTGVVSGDAAVGMSGGDVFANSDPSKMFYLLEGEQPWINLPRSQMSYVPDYAIGLVSTVSLYTLTEGQVLAFQCPLRMAYEEGCYMLAFQYRCSGCEFENGGLPKRLLGEDWDSAHCSPRFRLSDGGPEYPMATFVKAVAKGTTLQIQLEKDTQFVIQTGFRSRYLCEQRLSEGACQNTPKAPGYCYWHRTLGECKLNLCWKNYGPSPINRVCKQCPKDELEAVNVQSETGRRR